MIKFAVVGLGNIGKRHAMHIANCPDAQLSAVCDIRTDRCAAYPEVPFFADIDSLLAESDADVVCICTPNYLHCEHTLRVLASGKHAVVEKPMALSVHECDQMIAAAEASGKMIFAVKQNRYNPPVAAVKELIESGRLGRIFMVQVNCFWNRGDSYYAESDWRGQKAKDGGCLFTQFSHFVDILYYLNGPVRAVSGITDNFAHRHNTEFEDTGSFVMHAENGSLVNFNFTTCAHEKNMEGAITIFAEGGTVKIGGQYLNTIEYQNISGEALPDINIAAKNNDYGLYQGSMSNHDKLIENVVRVLQEGAQMTTTAAEGRAVIAMIEQMYASVKNNSSIH